MYDADDASRTALRVLQSGSLGMKRVGCWTNLLEHRGMLTFVALLERSNQSVPIGSRRLGGLIPGDSSCLAEASMPSGSSVLDLVFPRSASSASGRWVGAAERPELKSSPLLFSTNG
jgi:hypothetical protein